MRVLTANAGSTSWKGALVVDGVAVEQYSSLDDALRAEPDVVAHRVVHGGTREGPAVIDDALVEELTALVELAPLHQPEALEGIARTRAAWPDVPHVACFDTAFHRTIPEAARTYAIPERFRPTVQVYGFHGLSHAWSVSRVAALAPEARRVVVAHLGGGQSLCGALGGRSVTTTMGFTPLDGLVMATRCGAIDPGAVLWLAQREGEGIGDVLDTESGLLALAGTADMREVWARSETGDARARLAVDVWLHRMVAALGATTATLGGLDALVFTGGIGEHHGGVRRAVVAALDWLGVATRDPVDDPVADPAGPDEHEITAPGAAVRTFVVRAREDLRLAAEAEACLRRGAGAARSANG